MARQHPERYVFRLSESLERLLEWLDAESAERREESLLPLIGFDTDRDAPRNYPEGGRTAFRWRGGEFETVSLKVLRWRRDEVFTWVFAPDRASAEALVDALARFARRRSTGVMVFQDGDWEEAPRLEGDLSRYSWDSVVLPAPMIERLRRAAGDFFRSEAVYRELEIPWKMGFLFVGPPGTGKTLTTKVLANTCGVSFLYVRGLNGFCEAQPDPSTLREMFRGARDRAPCLLCLEDLDSVVTGDLRSAFLNELDGLEEDYRGVLTVGTTNHPERLDPALLHRPARFDYRFEFPLPDEGQRRSFIRHWMEKLVRTGYVTSAEAAAEELARRSRGMSHAYLQRVFIGIAMRMTAEEERGDAAFSRLALEELADAETDRAAARRAESSAGADASGARVGFRPE